LSIKNLAKDDQRVTTALAAHKTMERKIRAEDLNAVEMGPSLKRAKRTFNNATSSTRIRECDPKNIPEALKTLGTPRPPGIGFLNEFIVLPDFFLVYQEQRDNFPPFLIFSNLTGSYNFKL
jgi:hypothetical protein